jgi:predicted small lipoprotein YifL
MTRARRLCLLALLATATTGCGLKGPLTLPSKSDDVVIRGPGQVTTEPATAPETTPAPMPATPPATPPAEPRENQPPSLPGGDGGTAHGG